VRYRLKPVTTGVINTHTAHPISVSGVIYEIKLLHHRFLLKSKNVTALDQVSQGLFSSLFCESAGV